MFKVDDVVVYDGEHSALLTVITGSNLWRVFTVFDEGYLELQSVKGGLWLIVRVWEVRHV